VAKKLLLPINCPLEAAVEALLDAVDVLQSGKMFRVLGHNLARFEVFFVGELVHQLFRLILALFF